MAFEKAANNISSIADIQISENDFKVWIRKRQIWKRFDKIESMTTG